jgi:outer membrane protein
MAWAAEAGAPAVPSKPASADPVHPLRNDEPTSTDAPQPAAASQPLTLAAAQERALAQNPDWQAALERLRVAEAGVAEAKAGGRPQLRGLGVVYYTTNPPSFTAPPVVFGLPTVPPTAIPGRTFELGPSNNLQGILSIEQRLLGGPTEPNIRRARRELDAAQLRKERARQELLYRVEEAYLMAAVAAESLTVAQDNLRSRTAHRQVALSRFETGLAPQYDVVRAETEVSAGEEQVTRVANEYDLQIGRLALVLGDPLDHTYGLTLPTVPIGSSSSAPLAALIEQALEQRTDLAARIAEQQAANEEARVARAERKPILSLRGEARVNQKSQPLEPSRVRVEVDGTWLFNDGGRSRAEENAAEAQARALKQEREQLARTVALEVRSAFLSLQNARQRMATADHQVTQATSALEIAQARYDVGTGVSVEISDSQAALSDARFTRLRAQLDYLLADAQLRLALGATRPAAARDESRSGAGSRLGLRPE